MPAAHEFLTAITVVLCVAALTTVVFQRLRQPVVLGYILAGLIVGPFVPIPLVANREIIQTLSELGVILLMFALGLEFSVRKMVELAPTAGLTAVVQSSIMVWLGFMVGRALGWSARESIFAGAIIAISSTTIIAKAFDEQKIRGGLRELVVGILIVEDLIGILLMAILTAVSTGDGMSIGAVGRSSGRLAGFLAGVVVVGMLLVPRIVRSVQRLQRPETTLVTSIGICFGVALLAERFGYSVALGAFIAGSLVAESGEEKSIEQLILPVRDLFAAVFFVSVGMQIDPRVIARHWLAVVLFTVVVIVGKIFGVFLGAFLTGNGTRKSVQAGMSLAQIGEFSFIIAGLGISLRATNDFLYPIAVAVSSITTLTTPWLIRSSGRVAEIVDGKMPHALQTFAALYGTWLERIRARPDGTSRSAIVKRLGKLLLLDAAIVGAIVVGTSVSITNLTARLSSVTGLSSGFARGLIVLVAVAIVSPFVFGMVRVTRGLGIALAHAALPPVVPEMVDLAAAPRRTLVIALQLTVALLVGLPMLALIQPFLGGWTAVLVLALILIVLGIGFWRSTTNLEGHVKAGAQMLVEALVAQTGKPNDEDAFLPLKSLMPGLGDPVPVRIDEHSSAFGKTLAEINLRGATGASVLAIARGERGVIVPTAGEVLQAGDVLALAGTRDAVAAAKEILTNKK